MPRPSKIDRMRRRAGWPVVENVDGSLRGLATVPVDDEPTVEVGDRVLVDDDTKYRRVVATFPLTDAGVVVEGRSTPVFLHEITDVYTKAEQEANGALVFVHKDDIATHRSILDGSPILEKWHPSLIGGDFGELRNEATAALGEFQPVPERAIVPGDVVRDDVTKNVGTVAAAGENRHGPVVLVWGYELPAARFSLVAPEDPAYREAKEQPDGCTCENPVWASGPDCPEHDREPNPAPPVIKEPEPAPGIGSLLKHFGLDGNRYVTTDGRVVHEPDPAPHQHGGTDAPECTTCRNSPNYRPDPAPSIPEVYGEVQAARDAAHAKHGDNGIGALPGDSPRWLSILVEEVGEVAHELTYDSDGDLRKELIQVAAVATAWADALAAALHAEEGQ